MAFLFRAIVSDYLRLCVFQSIRLLIVFTLLCQIPTTSLSNNFLSIRMINLTPMMMCLVESKNSIVKVFPFPLIFFPSLWITSTDWLNMAIRPKKNNIKGFHQFVVINLTPSMRYRNFFRYCGPSNQKKTWIQWQCL